jgi:2-polyprenyl-3-methyl-5-hydroxy-6-metoxy-1,4-benzoquinol methylase
MNDIQLRFIALLRQSWSSETFVKLALGNYSGSEEQLKNCYIKKVIIKNEAAISFTLRYKTKDIVKNFSIAEAEQKIELLLTDGFKIATLFTTEADYIFEELLNKKCRIRKQNPSTKGEVTHSHDRVKNRAISTENKAYLHALQITDEKGQVYKAAQDKYKQINHFVELLQPLIKEIPDKPTLKVMDMGSGKGYLTFALYDYLTSVLHQNAEVKGVEQRIDLVDFCNKVATENQLTGLSFAQGAIADMDCSGQDILIALHACDTATDDAIFQGIKANSDLIVVAPCCHKQIRKQMEAKKAENALAFITRHGLFLERQAEMITDSIRALLLAYYGYKIKVIDFIADTHTPKNVMLIGIKGVTHPEKQAEILQQIKKAKAFFGINFHYLEQKLGL